MKRLALVAATLALGACQATSSAYQAAGGPTSVGYFSAPVDNGRQAVVYTGAKGMKPAQVAEYALLRAAEVTLASGNQWFAVLHSTNQQVRVGDINRIDGRTGAVLTGEAATAGSGGDRSTAAPGVTDPSVPGGPSTGGFGGGDVPYQVIERWTPPTVHQTTLLIQMGSGQEANFPDLDAVPDIYSAQEIVDQIRGKMGR